MPRPTPPALSRGSKALAAAALLLIALALVLIVRVLAPPPVPTHPPSLTSAPAPPPPPPPEDRTPEIRGHVLDADGNAVAGATVRLVSPSPPYTVYRDSQSDRAGAFSFPHAGLWRARVVADHPPEGIVTSAVIHATEGQTIELTLVLSAAGGVRGTVVDAQSHPVSGAAVSVEGVPWIIPPATSDEAGAFRLTTVPDEATSLVAVARGYRSARAPLGPRADGAEIVVRVVLTSAEPVSGDVRDDQGNPVRARVVACEDQPSEARVISDADGSFQLPPSAIGCAAVAEQAEFAPSDAAQVVEGQHLSLRLKTGGSIAGVVVTDRGEGVPSFSLGVESFSPARGAGFDRVAPRTFEDPRGAFRLDRLAPGTYVLTAAAAGTPPARSSPVDVRGGVVTGDVRIALSPGGTLTGYVFDDAHAPIAGADLRFDQVSSVLASKAAAQTDATGLYRLDGAPEGPFTLLAHKDGFRTKLVSGVRVASGTSRRIDVTLGAIDGGGGLELGGIGAALEQRNGAVSLAQVYAGDPAASAGLRVGDRIVRVDGEATDGMSLADVLQRLRGEPGSSVGVSAFRPETGENVQLTIVRGRIVR